MTNIGFELHLANKEFNNCTVALESKTNSKTSVTVAKCVNESTNW